MTVCIYMVFSGIQVATSTAYHVNFSPEGYDAIIVVNTCTADSILGIVARATVALFL